MNDTQTRHTLRRVAAAVVLIWLATTPVLIAQPAGRTYPSARHGGNYMHNFYFPPAPSSTPWTYSITM